MQGKCDVCGEVEEVVVCCSATGAVSFAYCSECLQSGREPYFALAARLIGIASIDNVAEWFLPIVRVTLEAEGKTEEELFKDVRAFEEEYERETTN